MTIFLKYLKHDQQNQRGILVGSFLILAMGCSQNTSNLPAPAATGVGPASTSTPPTLASLQGTWTTQCNTNPPGNGSYTFSFQFSSNSVTEIETVYTDSQCSSQNLATYFTGSFQLVSLTNLVSPNSVEIDLSFTGVEEMTQSASFAQELNTANNCGISNWQVGVIENVTQNCGPQNSVPSTVPAVLNITGGMLYILENGGILPTQTQVSTITTTTPYTQ